MKLVKQEDAFGCGFACLASLLSVSYRESLSLIDDGKNKAKQRGLYCRDIVNILRANGFKRVGFQHLKIKARRRGYENGMIVYVKKSKRYPSGHYLLRTDGRWMDPWINFVDGRDVKHARGGYRKRLPGTAVYRIFTK